LSKLLLVRHGLTEYNRTRRFAGHTDIDLNPDGIQQVEKLRDRLADEKIDTVYSSDLKRAMSTAEIVSAGHDAEPVLCPELREINYGDIEGLTFEEIKKQYPDMADSLANFTTKIQFSGGESFSEFTIRTCRFLEKLKEHTPEETVLIAAHGGPLTTLVCELLGIGQSHWRAFHIDNASLSIIHTYPKGGMLTLFNDTSHLKNEGREG